MNGILDLLKGETGTELIKGVSKQTNQPADKTQSVLTMALPLLMTAMKRNASSPDGAQGLLGALQSNKHDGSILNNLSGLLGGGVDAEVMNDGSKILGHVLGKKQSHIEKTLGAKAGMDVGSVAQILKVAAPIIMGMLAKKTQEKQVHSSSGLEDLLGNLLGGNNAEQEQSFLERILDADGDGSVIDDVAGMVLGGDKNKGGLGGMLGGFLGGK